MDFGFRQVNTGGRGNYQPFYGTIAAIDSMTGTVPRNTGCSQMVTVRNEEGQIADFLVTPDTYVVDFVMLYEGQRVILFHDINAPAPLIYPPRYRAVVAAQQMQGVNIAVGFFNQALVNIDQTLKLNMAPSTEVVTANNQRYRGSVAGKNLIVLYSAATRSIPAQTTPDKVIVMCRMSGS